MSRDATGLDFDELALNSANWDRLKKELDRLRLNNEEQLLAIRLNNIGDFVLLHYAALPTSRSCIEAFNRLNDLYFNYYGEYRYSSYQKFCRARSEYFKKRGK